MWGARFGATAIAIVCVVGVGAAIACGPYLPWQLLDNRTETLKSTPSNSFNFEAAHIAAAPRDHLTAIELDPQGTEDQSQANADAAQKGLSSEQNDLVSAMWRTADGDAAFAAGNGLPMDVRFYTAGARDYLNKDYAKAAVMFRAVLALGKNQQDLRGVWAAFMLGKIAAASNDIAGMTNAFRQTRALAVKGLQDPLGLAVASYGEEAKVHFEAANRLLQGSPTPPQEPTSADSTVQWTDPVYGGIALPPQNSDAYRREMATAVGLYAEQAARGSNIAVQSLRIAALDILNDPSRVAAVVSAPEVQRLLVIYVLARVEDDTNQQAQDALVKPDAGPRERGVTPSPILVTLVDAIVKSGIDHPVFADRLAALCYRTGRYDLATKLANQSSSPLAQWVDAKLALQRGDLAGAAAHYAAAVRGFPSSANGVLTTDNETLLRGEAGTLSLARGEYVDALDKLYPLAATYWGDVAQLAERVLTTDELKSFVDANVPAPATSVTASASLPVPASQLRDLLARRLVREGRYEEADSYFSDRGTKARADAYAAALHEGTSDWGRVDSAEAYFKAAVIARENGMEIMGTEVEPDYAATGGDFDFGYGQSELGKAYVTAGERARFATSKAVPDLRYHYRYIAVDEANRAADLLPPRSQAFAAVLCTATGWMMATPGAQPRVKAIYHRYVKEGAYVSWAKMFGTNCPKPNFDEAIYLERITPLREARHFVARHRWPVLGGAIVLVLLIAAIGLWFLGILPRAFGRKGSV